MSPCSSRQVLLFPSPSPILPPFLPTFVFRCFYDRGEDTQRCNAWLVEFQSSPRAWTAVLKLLQPSQPLQVTGHAVAVISRQGNTSKR
eukprot:g73452.t1